MGPSGWMCWNLPFSSFRGAPWLRKFGCWHLPKFIRDFADGAAQKSLFFPPHLSHLCPGMTQEFPNWECPALLREQLHPLLPKPLLIFCSPEFIPARLPGAGSGRATFPCSFPSPAARRVPVHPSFPSPRSHTIAASPRPPSLHTGSLQQWLFHSPRASPAVGLGAGGGRDCSHSLAPATESEGIPHEL